MNVLNFCGYLVSIQLSSGRDASKAARSFCFLLFWGGGGGVHNKLLERGWMAIAIMAFCEQSGLGLP